ncbi:MAG TPA: phytanoyl-CoA dioxygenase family protein [Aequorivita sp.]|nr:phytanoyl-CoA dioxygenase family protein [Aequorivita sp.]
MGYNLKRLKLLYETHNLFHYNKLKYLLPLYQKYGIRKNYFSSLSSNTLPADSVNDHPWLDREDSATVLPQNPIFSSFSEQEKAALLQWSTNGYAILKGFYSEEKVASINQLLVDLMKDKKMPVKDKRKIMYAVRYSSQMRELVHIPKLADILSLLMGTSIELFQSVNFLQGSEDPAHSDFIHMSTYPYGYLLAVWIALEDIDMENGPLFFHPGSHKLPYIMNSQYDHGGNRWLLGKTNKKNYAQAIDKIIKEHHFETKTFTASKGDVLIWHANLLHGGTKIINPDRTRKSMVMHYFGADVIQYHEITQRPSLKPAQ